MAAFGIYYGTYVTLVLGPFAGIVAVLILRQRDPARLRALCVASAIIILVVAGSVATRIRTSSTALDSACCLIALLAACLLAAAAWTIKVRTIAYAAGLLAHGTLASCLGLLISFPTGFVLMFVLGDVFSPPVYAEELSPSLSCRVWSWGTAFSDEGYTVAVYRHLPFVPLVQIEAAHVVVNMTEAGNGPRSASCEGVAAALSRRGR